MARQDVSVATPDPTPTPTLAAEFGEDWEDGKETTTCSCCEAGTTRTATDLDEQGDDADNCVPERRRSEGTGRPPLQCRGMCRACAGRVQGVCRGVCRVQGRVQRRVQKHVQRETFAGRVHRYVQGVC